MGLTCDDAVLIEKGKKAGEPYVVTVNCPDKTGLGCDICYTILEFGLYITRGGLIAFLLLSLTRFCRWYSWTCFTLMFLLQTNMYCYIYVQHLCYIFSIFCVVYEIGGRVATGIWNCYWRECFVFKKLSGDVDIPQNLVKSLICNCLWFWRCIISIWISFFWFWGLFFDAVTACTVYWRYFWYGDCILFNQMRKFIRTL